MSKASNAWPITLMHMARSERDAGIRSVAPQVALRVALAFAWEAEVRRDYPDAVGVGFQARPQGTRAPDPEDIFQTLITRIEEAGA